MSLFNLHTNTSLFINNGKFIPFVTTFEFLKICIVTHLMERYIFVKAPAIELNRPLTYPFPNGDLLVEYPSKEVRYPINF